MTYAYLPEKLTPREVQVLDLLVQGKRPKEIAVTLGLARTTVSTYIEKARLRTRCATPAQMGAWYSEWKKRLCPS